MSTEKQFLSQSAFAKQQGWAKSYITQLKQAGRLVMDESGKRVDVAASLARIEATASPDKSSVSDRHASARGQGAADEAGERGETEGDDADAPVDRRDYQDARARREAANATLAEIEVGKAAGALMEAAQVESELADAVTTLRAALESMGALLSPQLAAETDPREIRQIIDDHVHAALHDVAARFAAIGRAGEVR